MGLARPRRRVTLSLISTAESEREIRLSQDMCNAVLDAITVAPQPSEIADAASMSSRVAARAVALGAVLSDTPDALSRAEQLLLGEWLDRLSMTG